MHFLTFPFLIDVSLASRATLSPRLQICKIIRIQDRHIANGSDHERICAWTSYCIIYSNCACIINKCLPFYFVTSILFIVCHDYRIFFMFLFCTLTSMCIYSDATSNACLYIIINTMY